ncbi:MAG: hypothetical protein RJA25_1476 [Bacteroidota bacterium]|jgi:septal ring factor EnvC (AmiA/AmiB activator)
MNWKKWKDKLKNVYRFQIIDEKSYDVKMVLELNPLNILTIVGILLAFFTVLNFLFIAFTPLKQYIPGYGTSAGRKEAIKVNMKAEDLKDKVQAQQKYITNLQNILNDNIVVAEDIKNKKINNTKVDTGILSVKTRDESKFVQEVEKGLKNAELLESVYDSKKSPLSNLQIQSPVDGKIISKFSETNTSISFSAKPDEEVKAVLSGNIIFSGYTPENGYYLIIQAENQLVYILKNNSQLLKKTSNFVNRGEVVARAGKSGKNNNYSTSLEIWYRGHPIDPQEFIKQ